MVIEILLGVLIILLIFNIWLTYNKSATDISQYLNDIRNSIKLIDNSLEKVDKSIRDDFQRNREESNKIAKENREELTNSLSKFSDNFASSVKEFNKTTGEKLDKIRETVESKLQSIQEDNSQKLEKMRETVDEKLHKTLEHRLGESFKIVSESLEKVQKGLGEMQTLATGVGDLKKVLSNVKTRGVLGEYQLENILEQILTSSQYEKNVKTNPDSDAFVEFAIRLPGKNDVDKEIWLPLDSKFPTEDYQLLMDAHDNAEPQKIEIARKELARKIKLFAREIKERYVDPPNTTDFAIMFLPIEGLYAEVLRDSGLFETLQREYRVIVTGPTTLSALLSSLQMGFRTLAIEKRSSEVWEILGAVKTEFGKFGEILEKTRKKLSEATDVVDKAGVRSRAIERKLKDVQELPPSKAVKMLKDHSEEKS
ncbi:MAG: DNA recombination protein RmuC [Calditrichia bacterium]|nr:DNA recombination protein RmuC [Calditrichia bacterium]